MYYETDLNDLIENGNNRETPLRKVSLGRSPSVLEYAQALTASANAKVGPARHASLAAVKEVVIREAGVRVGQPKSVAHFGIVRAVENFLSVATQNNATTPHIDLLPVGHPLAPRPEALTASAYAVERADWEAGTLNANPHTKALVASVLSADPETIEYKFALNRLKASAPDVLARIV